MTGVVVPWGCQVRRDASNPAWHSDKPAYGQLVRAHYMYHLGCTPNSSTNKQSEKTGQEMKKKRKNERSLIDGIM